MDTTNETGPEANASAFPPITGSTNVNVGEVERILSALGGTALGVMAFRDMKRPASLGMLLAGGFLLARGVSGYCAINNALGRNTAHKSGSAVEVATQMTVNRPANELYTFWRNFENLPRIMKHLRNVEDIDQTHSRWTAQGPAGVGTVTWEAEIVEDRPNEVIAWRSLPGSTIDNAGQVRFRETPEGTELRVQMSYRLPAGDIGGFAGRMLSPVAERILHDDIRDLKTMMESGAERTEVRQ